MIWSRRLFLASPVVAAAVPHCTKPLHPMGPQAPPEPIDRNLMREMGWDADRPQEGLLHVLAGPSKSGRSMIALNVAMEHALRGRRVLYLSDEFGENSLPLMANVPPINLHINRLFSDGPPPDVIILDGLHVQLRRHQVIGTQMMIFATQPFNGRTAAQSPGLEGHLDYLMTSGSMRMMANATTYAHVESGPDDNQFRLVQDKHRFNTTLRKVDVKWIPNTNGPQLVLRSR